MVLGTIDDFWYRWVADVGITGADRGKGGKYLILPPGYTGEIPSGYFVVRPKTYGNWMPFRSFLVNGSPKPGVESVKKTPQDPSALGCRESPRHEIRQCLRHSVEFRRARRLFVLEPPE